MSVMQELELMVDGLPWAPDHPPCSGGVLDDVLQHVHGAYKNKADQRMELILQTHLF